MFDIGGPEFLVIAIVALVVLGPERLPTVMRRVGQLYRQVREMASQYTTEAQRMFEEGMKEVEEVSSSISNTFNEALTDSNQAAGPPPRLRQLPPPLLAPDTAAAAGPWTLPAWHRDSRNDLEPHQADYRESPFAQARREPEETFADDLAGIGGPALMGPAAEHEDLVFPREEATQPPAVPQVPTPATSGRNGASRPTEGSQPGAAPVDGRHGAGGADEPASVRERTLIELCRAGSITLEKGAEFLGLDPEEFLARIERAAAAEQARG